MARILVIAPSAYLLGGVQNWLDYLLPALDGAGHRTTLGLVSGHWHRAGEYLDRHPFANTITIDNPTGSAMGRVNAMVRAIRSLGPDIVMSVNMGPALEAMRIIKSGQRVAPRLVMTMHAIEPDYFAELAYHADVVDGVVATNRLALRLAEEYAGLPAERLFYAPYGVAIPERVPEPGPVKTVLWMGRLEQPQKRVMELPGIASRLARGNRAWRLRVAGDGPESAALTEALQSRGSTTVEFLGHVDHARILSEVLPSADVLLVNSTWETGPITIWEAMAMGVAVVSSRYVGSGREAALKDGENALLFDVGDISGAAERLERLRDDTRLHRRVVAGGRALVRRRYAMVASTQAWLSALDNVMGLPVTDPAGRFEAPRPSGRLDRLLGVRRAEMVRKIMGVRFRHAGPGDEWPHVSRGMSRDLWPDFMVRAAELDRQPADPS